jgi:hypothetical protein
MGNFTKLEKKVFKVTISTNKMEKKIYNLRPVVNVFRFDLY